MTGFPEPSGGKKLALPPLARTAPPLGRQHTQGRQAPRQGPGASLVVRESFRTDRREVPALRAVRRAQWQGPSGEGPRSTVMAGCATNTSRLRRAGRPSGEDHTEGATEQTMVGWPQSPRHTFSTSCGCPGKKGHTNMYWSQCGDPVGVDWNGK